MPFLKAKNFQSVHGEVHSIRKLKSDDLFVEVSTATQSDLLSKSRKIGSFSVSIEAHKTLNFSYGVISVADLLHSTANEELLKNLKMKTSLMPAKYLYTKIIRFFHPSILFFHSIALN